MTYQPKNLLWAHQALERVHQAAALTNQIGRFDFRFLDQALARSVQRNLAEILHAAAVRDLQDAGHYLLHEKHGPTATVDLNDLIKNCIHVIRRRSDGRLVSD
jgi:hypothetical protein